MSERPASGCPIARGLDAVGDRWSLLILRDALDGATRFDQFARGLGIAPNILTRRLHALVADGLLERRRYQQRPPRDEYVLTDRGRDLQPVLVALAQWGARDVAPGDRSIQLVDRRTGATLDPVLVDRATGTPISDLDAGFGPGPGASPATRARFAALAE